MAGCDLCERPGGHTVWQDGACRVVRVDDADYPGFCRVIWQEHVSEMSDLSVSEQRHLYSVVNAVESALRALLRPDKINLASLGNQVPHLHWHVIPRWRDDRHFPQPVWAAPLRESAPRRAAPSDASLHDAVIRVLAEAQAGAA
jgi:diadenosine tetraphosphate (Ap4A) HIT family hydrolase